MTTLAMSNVGKKILLFLIKVYQWVFRPILGNRCRFSPSCSEYMAEAVIENGVIKGGFMGIKRLLRCGPWSLGGYDPVPKKTNQDL
jgi:putative membrane protein insertion efficiency factor